MRKQFAFTAIAAWVYVVLGCVVLPPVSQSADKAVGPPIVADALSGVVTSPKGAEAGVWVIAETKDFRTRYIKIVVTDDNGRYLLPELPKANYQVWVRGYGLVDSKPVPGVPGKNLDLTAVIAPSAQAAAQYYPASYWYSLIHPPAATEFPGTGPKGNGLPVGTRQEWLSNLKTCVGCHQLGSQITRTLANNTVEGWRDRIQQMRPPDDPVSAHNAEGYTAGMQGLMGRLGFERGLNMFTDWTGRIAKGEIPKEAPPRPSGVERNVVITEWDWGNGTFIHDEVSSDRRDPTVNANGPVYGTAPNLRRIVVLDPKKNSFEEVQIPTSGYGYNHSIMMDGKSRIWLADFGTAFQTNATPGPRADFCSHGDLSKYAQYFPFPGPEEKIRLYDPATKQVTTIPSCFRSEHLWFDKDANNTLYFAGDEVEGWIDTKVWDDTHDAQKAVGWCPMVLDTKQQALTKTATGGDSVTIEPDHTKWNVWGKSANPTRDTRIAIETYGVSVNQRDGSVWVGIRGPYPGGILRFERGQSPPQTCKTEFYQPPKLPDGSYAAFLPQDVMVDSKGIAWVSFRDELGRFDRSKCKVMSGPSATGQQCQEGWTFYEDPKSAKLPGTNMNGNYYYQMYIDYRDIFDLGKDVPLVANSNGDSMMALMPDTGEYKTFRVPYPMGFYGRWVDGRIDNPKTGWKGRGIWSDFGIVPVWHQEGGDEVLGPELVKFQMRPDPLAH